MSLLILWMTFLTMNLLPVFQAIRTNPSVLRQNLPAMVAKLHAQGNAAAQGTGNMPTVQEACFASLLEANGFRFQSKNAPFPTAPGNYYYYQANGSQQSIDFRVIKTDGKDVIRAVDLDLKHTTSDVFFLNDGWFHKDVIYIVTWTRRTSLPKKKPITSEVATFIGLGQDICSAAENDLMNRLLIEKKKLNTEFKGVESLSIYVRFANRYKCDRFTPEFTETRFAAVNKYVHSSSVSGSSVASSVA